MIMSLPAMQETWVQSLGLGRSPRERKRQLTPGFLPGKSQGQRSLAGYSLWGGTESDVAEHLTIRIMLSDVI